MGVLRNIDFTQEISFATSRSGGKGGQHVNKVETKVELEFEVMASQLLTKEQKNLVMAKLANRINNEGRLKISVQESKSQKRNKEIALERFYELVEEAVQQPKKRKKPRPPKELDEARLEKKKQRAEKKKTRKNIDPGKYNY